MALQSTHQDLHNGTREKRKERTNNTRSRNFDVGLVSLVCRVVSNLLCVQDLLYNSDDIFRLWQRILFQSLGVGHRDVRSCNANWRGVQVVKSLPCNITDIQSLVERVESPSIFLHFTFHKSRYDFSSHTRLRPAVLDRDEMIGFLD